MTSLSAALLEEMIEQATVDCYNHSEQVCGLFTAIEHALIVPFKTTVLDLPVTVTGVDLTVDDRIVALVRRDRHLQRVAVLDLPLPSPPPAGAEWIAAYRHWATHNGWA